MKKICVSIIAAGIVILAAQTSHAVMLTNGISTEGLGSFTGSFVYSYSDSTTGQIVVNLTNTTSPASYGGYLTAFAFNNPVDNLIDLNEYISSVSGFVTTDVGGDFSLLSGPILTGDEIDANPFGEFDIGAAATNDWLGGGSPSGGLAIGESAQFTFSLTGVGLDALTSESFFTDLAKSSGNTGGDYGPQNFVVRFRGLAEPPTAGSDKVVGVPNVVPEPTSMLLFGTGLAGAFLRRRFQA